MSEPTVGSLLEGIPSKPMNDSFSGGKRAIKLLRQKSLDDDVVVLLPPAEMSNAFGGKTTCTEERYNVLSMVAESDGTTLESAIANDDATPILKVKQMEERLVPGVIPMKNIVSKVTKPVEAKTKVIPRTQKKPVDLKSTGILEDKKK
ncbi:unnamed protein product [Soboliphyme baturini]|uniref:DUF4604 domain-containing protein n=1 Tax=Soboliphyme baturini TaxID=241478 RepID=A0A183ICD7_9BILA|nr:unnamed protein product [Soboliphyme baturini]